MSVVASGDTNYTAMVAVRATAGNPTGHFEYHGQLWGVRNDSGTITFYRSDELEDGPIVLGDVIVDSLTIGSQQILATSILLTNGEVVDLNGEADALVLDADADTTISAPTDDQIDIEISNADDFRFVANVFRALSGSVIETDTLNETTGAAGVTIDGALLKDGRSNLGRQVQALTSTNAITIKSGLVTLAHGTVAIAATLAAPVAGDELIIVNTSASGTAAHTVTVPAGVTFDGTNNTATLNAPDEALHIVAVSATRWYIVDNNGSVGLSSV